MGRQHTYARQPRRSAAFDVFRRMTARNDKNQEQIINNEIFATYSVHADKRPTRHQRRASQRLSRIGHLKLLLSIEVLSLTPQLWWCVPCIIAEPFNHSLESYSLDERTHEHSGESNANSAYVDNQGRTAGQTKRAQGAENCTICRHCRLVNHFRSLMKVVVTG